MRDISWRVAPGQHWVMLGANGSGKTSLLSALTGYLMPTSGEISLLGQRYGDEVEIVNGLVATDRFVSSGQFLLDAEASLQSGLDQMDADPMPKEGASP